MSKKLLCLSFVCNGVNTESNEQQSVDDVRTYDDISDEQKDSFQSISKHDSFRRDDRYRENDEQHSFRHRKKRTKDYFPVFLSDKERKKSI